MFDSDKRDTAHNVSHEDTITIHMDPRTAQDVRDILTHLDESYSTLDQTVLGCSRSEIDSLLDAFQAAIMQDGKLVLKIAKRDQLTLKSILAYAWTSLKLDEEQKTRLASFVVGLVLAMENATSPDAIRKLLQLSDQHPIVTKDSGGTENTDTIGHGSLASPTPPDGGNTNRQGDAPHETEGPTDRRSNENTMTLTLGPKTFRDVLEASTYFYDHYYDRTVDRIRLQVTHNEIRRLLETLKSAADIDGNKVFTITMKEYLTIYFTYTYADSFLIYDEQRRARWEALTDVEFQASAHQHVADEEPRTEE